MDYISARNREFQTTLRVLEAYPESHIHLKPAEKSRTAGQLALTLAMEERVLTAVLQTGATDPNLQWPDVPSAMAGIIALWQQAAAENDRVLAALSPKDFEKPVNFYGMQIPLVDALWFELLDHIHHRGQFSVYIRLAGGKLPSIYGPTADEPMQLG